MIAIDGWSSTPARAGCAPTGVTLEPLPGRVLLHHLVTGRGGLRDRMGACGTTGASLPLGCKLQM